MKAIEKTLKFRRRRPRRLDDMSSQAAYMNEARGVKAFLKSAKPLPWEGTRYDLARPKADFGAQAMQFMVQISELEDAMIDLESKNYPGIGNDKLKLQNVIDDLTKQSDLRHDQELLIHQLSKNELIKAITELKSDSDDDIPSLKELRGSAFTKTELILLLTETMNQSVDEIVDASQIRLPPPPPPRSTRNSPIRQAITNISPPRIPSSIEEGQAPISSPFEELDDLADAAIAYGNHSN